MGFTLAPAFKIKYNNSDSGVVCAVKDAAA